MFAPIAFVLLLRQQLAIAIDRWHTAYGVAVGDWLRAVGDVEALGALATYAYERPSDPFPELADAGPLLRRRGARAPAARPGRRREQRRSARRQLATCDRRQRLEHVRQEHAAALGWRQRGAGLAGAPVAARRLTMSALALGATLHIEDSLQAGHSRFFAEILRLRTIADAARGPIPLLFLLDEILHGTNSHDRRIGAEGIVRALVGLGAIGLVTTHDLALTELPATLGSAVNMHFEDRLEGGKMIFDYRMRPGVVEHSNALALMRAIGLDV